MGSQMRQSGEQSEGLRRTLTVPRTTTSVGVSSLGVASVNPSSSSSLLPVRKSRSESPMKPGSELPAWVRQMTRQFPKLEKENKDLLQHKALLEAKVADQAAELARKREALETLSQNAPATADVPPEADVSPAADVSLELSGSAAAAADFRPETDVSSAVDGFPEF